MKRSTNLSYHVQVCAKKLP